MASNHIILLCPTKKAKYHKSKLVPVMQEEQQKAAWGLGWGKAEGVTTQNQKEPKAVALKL